MTPRAPQTSVWSDIVPPTCLIPQKLRVIAAESSHRLNLPDFGADQETFLSKCQSGSRFVFCDCSHSKTRLSHTGQRTHPLRFVTAIRSGGLAPKHALLKKIVSGQRDVWKHLCSLKHYAASKYSVYGMEQLPRNNKQGENFVAVKSDGRNGPLGMVISTQKKRASRT